MLMTDYLIRHPRSYLKLTSSDSMNEAAFEYKIHPNPPMSGLVGLKFKVRLGKKSELCDVVIVAPLHVPSNHAYRGMLAPNSKLRLKLVDGYLQAHTRWRRIRGHPLFIKTNARGQVLYIYKIEPTYAVDKEESWDENNMIELV